MFRLGRLFQRPNFNHSVNFLLLLSCFSIPLIFRIELGQIELLTFSGKIILQSVDVSRHQCDQIWRFIGLWATF